MTPADLRRRVRIPVFAAPMFLVSGPDLVIACCQAGVVGSFPAMNARTAGGSIHGWQGSPQFLKGIGEPRPML